MNAQNKEIKKRELAKIKKVPQKFRAKMRTDLKKQLKERTDRIKAKLPAKIADAQKLKEAVSTGPKILAI